MRAFPAVRAEGLLSERVGDETVVYDSESGAAHCLRPVAAAVFARCNGQSSVQEIAQLVSDDLRHTIDEAAVEDALAQLREHALLERPEETEPFQVTISRRSMLRRSATVGGAMAAAPLIASIVAPTAAAAVNICKTTDSSGNPVPCNSAQDCGCPTSSSCTPSVPGTCLCKEFEHCGTPPSGYSGWCAFHPPNSSGVPCSPSCANGTKPC